MDTRVKPAYDAVRVEDARKFIRSSIEASVIAARKYLRVNGGSVNLPREIKKEVERRKARLR
jgi:hypothetical protein